MTYLIVTKASPKKGISVETKKQAENHFSDNDNHNDRHKHRNNSCPSQGRRTAMVRPLWGCLWMTAQYRCDFKSTARTQSSYCARAERMPHDSTISVRSKGGGEFPPKIVRLLHALPRPQNDTRARIVYRLTIFFYIK